MLPPSRITTCYHQVELQHVTTKLNYNMLPPSRITARHYQVLAGACTPDARRPMTGTLLQRNLIQSALDKLKYPTNMLHCMLQLLRWNEVFTDRRVYFEDSDYRDTWSEFYCCDILERGFYVLVAGPAAR